MITLQDKLGYQFKDPSLLTLALTHKSYENESRRSSGIHNERLEFLGDAVLELALTEELVRELPQHSEGDLSKIRASLVNEAVLSQLARDLGIDELLLLGRGEILSGGSQKPRLLASALEAVLGAVFSEAGYDTSREIVRSLFRERLRRVEGEAHFVHDFKTRFQEMAQERFKATPLYRVVREEGPDHDKTFYVEVHVDGRVLGAGSGRSKKLAEQDAARAAMESLK